MKPRRITLATTPFDATGEAWDDDPMPAKPPKVRQRPPPAQPLLTPVTARTPLEVIGTRCFTASLNASDLRYIALAVLQVQDEACELRERVRQLEAALLRMHDANEAMVRRVDKMTGRKR
jgi:hypothetical protein